MTSPDIYDRYQAICERSNELRAWAASRIEHCRRIDDRCSGRDRALTGRELPITAEVICAAQERRTLEAVLRILDGEALPVEST